MKFASDSAIATLELTDVSGQKAATLTDVPRDATVGELIDSVLAGGAGMDLTRNDTEGRPLTYAARLEREGRHLHASETLGDVVQSGDRLTLTPSINAG